MSNSKILVKNETERELRVRVDCDRNIIVKDSTVKFDVKYSGVGFGFSTSENVEHDVFHVVNTEHSFTTIHVTGTAEFGLEDNKEYHAYMTVLSKNDDGSWYMIAENHPITKRCHVVISSGIDVRQNYSNYVQCNKGLFLQKALPFAITDAALTVATLAAPIFVQHRTPMTYQMVTNSSSDYRFGRIVVFNESSKNLWVKLDADGIRVKKLTTRDTVHLNVTQAIGSLNNATGSIEATSNSTLEHNIYYRANQKIGVTLIPKKNDTDVKPTVFYLNSTDNQYYLSIDYENENGSREQYYYNHPGHLLDVKINDGAFIPCIIASDYNNKIKVEIHNEKIEFDEKPVVDVLKDAFSHTIWSKFSFFSNAENTQNENATNV